LWIFRILVLVVLLTGNFEITHLVISKAIMTR
jgi:hypothetical protein